MTTIDSHAAQANLASAVAAHLDRLSHPPRSTLQPTAQTPTDVRELLDGSADAALRVDPAPHLG